MTPRKPKDLIGDVVEALLAMANAEGGSVALGVEDDGTVTGVPPQLKLEKVKTEVRHRTRPPLPLQVE